MFKAFEPKMVTPNFGSILQLDPDRIVATWIGHSTFLLQIGGLNFLTDPHFGSHCAPVPLPAFRRKTEPGLKIEHLPRIDAILLGHNHYDHLDLSTLRLLGRGTDIYCPTGVGRLLGGIGARRVTEMSWGESALFNDVRLVCLPAQHGSARTPFDRNRSLWCGWMLEHSERRAAFLGDTGYAPLFAEIGEAFESIDLAMIPIGAYRPEWFMRPLHMNPAEAAQVHLDLKAKQSVAMHWGTFLLADDPLGEPPMLLEQARKAAGIEPEEFRVLGIGETILV
jgi:N-acyl-phosphatidylethanolamine-hydrolysing phospholipase D